MAEESDEAPGREPFDSADAFSLLGDETRLAIVSALHEGPVEPPVPFSTLYDHVDVDDTARFNYHLGKLRPHFVAKVEDGYELSSEVRLLARLSDALDNHGAPAFVSVAGNPETGKANAGWLLVELRKHLLDDLLVLSNAAGSLTDIRVTSMHELTELLIEHRDRPKAVVLDECSTHMDARTHRRDVAEQWTPVAKRMAKLNVDVQLNIVHSGKDYHPEGKRLTTLAVWKPEKTVAVFYANWPADGDRPTNELSSGPVSELEPTGVEYDPDDTAPWSWDLQPGLFEVDQDWPGFLTLLQERGRVED